MKISVIIPVYNLKHILDQCLDSVVAQTYNDWEVLLIDDGSSDGSGEICDKRAQGDCRIRVFHKANGGVSSARNLGLANVTGDYIAFVDGDDTIKPNMFATLLRCAREHEVDIVTSDLEQAGTLIHNRLPPRQAMRKPEIQHRILPMFTLGDAIGVFAFTNKLFRADLIMSHKILFQDHLDWQEDLIFMIDIFAHAESVYYIPEAYYQYMPTSNGLYTSFRIHTGMKLIESYKKINQKIQEYHIHGIDLMNWQVTFLYNITWFIYRAGNYCQPDEAAHLIRQLLADDTVLEVCKNLARNATSFDRRMASAICNGPIWWAIKIIRFVHSGKAAKLQRVIARLR